MQKAIDYITVDFTTITAYPKVNMGDYGGSSKGGKRAKVSGGKQQVMEKNRHQFLEAQDVEKLTAPPFEKNELSLNPIKGESVLESGSKGVTETHGGGVGLAGYGHAEGRLGTVMGIDGAGTGIGGKGGGFGYGGTNVSDYAYLRDIIVKNITYPEKARKMGWEGRVILSFAINETGTINEIKILKSSGYPLLDEAAKEALLKIDKLQKRHERLIVQLPVEFRLK
ncbi:MAG: energy transducer TonB [Syntrophorhabdaceae bacterium]|nr:energy transducer TonB [Syntrophorhabdaceae bacterium]